jgi:hypothetical protein
MLSNSKKSLETLLLQRQTHEFIFEVQKDEKAFGEVINKPGVTGLTLLQLAAREGLSDAVLVLCLHGADVNFKGRSKTALELATDQQHGHTAKILNIFNPQSTDADKTILKAIYVYAVTHYKTPTCLTLPDAPQSICQGLLALAAFLNKEEWIEHFLLSYANYSYQHSIARTPAYWMACHMDELNKQISALQQSHNEDKETQQKQQSLKEKYEKTTKLFNRLAANQDIKILTTQQLQSDNRDDLADTLFANVVVPESLLEDKETLGNRYKNSYREASKNKTKLVTSISYETRLAVLDYAIKQNNFVATVVIHNCFNRGSQHDFIAATTDKPTVFDFELVSQNLSFYQFIFQLNPTSMLDKRLLQTHFNKIGILNNLIGAHLINKQLTHEQLAIYNVLLKNDEQVLQLVKLRLADMYLDINSVDAQHAYHRLLEDFGLTYLIKAKEKQVTISALPDATLQHIFSFLTQQSSVQIEVITESKATNHNNSAENKTDDHLIKEFKPYKTMSKEDKVVRKNLAETSKTFYAVVSGQRLHLEVALPNMELSLADLKAFKKKLNNDIALLTRFSHQINAGARSVSRWHLRWILPLSFMNIAGLAVNSWWLASLRIERKSLASRLSAISLNDGSNCNKYNLWHYRGCTNIVGTNEYGRDVTAPVPDVCAVLCGLLETADVNFDGSCAIASILIATMITLYYIAYDSANEYDCWDRQANLKFYSLKDYSESIMQQLPSILPLLNKSLTNESTGHYALSLTTDAITQKQADLKTVAMQEKFLLNRKNIFTLFKTASETKQESKPDIIINIPDYSEHKGEENEDFHEIEPVPNIGSLNNDGKTPLLNKGEVPRASICASCVIL